MTRIRSRQAQLSDLADGYLRCLLRGDRRQATTLVLDAVDSGASVRDIYLHVFQPAQYEIGNLWQQNRITVADEHFCTAATQLTMSLLYARLFDPTRELKNTEPVVVCAVAGELHELGARMVADLLEAAGWDTAYLGANTPIDALVAIVAARRAPLVSISVTLAAHVEHAAELISAIRASPDSEKVKVLVGGFAFRSAPALWESVGADATADDAPGAVEIVERLLSDGQR